MISSFSLISRHLCCKLVLVGSATGLELCLAATNELGTGVQLNCNGLDPAHGLVAVDAERVASWLAAAVKVASATCNFTESSSG
jgi:hypothetical protein